MVSKEEFQGWILDYACYHRIFPIIHAVSLHNSGHLEDLPVPHLRLACATINFIIESEQLSQFDVAIELVQQVNQTVPSSLVCQKTYLRLLTGLKIKALFHTLQDDPGLALVKLNTYFPRSTTKSTNPNEGQASSKFNKNHKNFRCFFFSLVSNDNQLRAYLREDYNDEFGPQFMESIKKLCERFLQKIESQLLPPMIEKVLACTECEKFSQISPATEMLLDFVQEKKLSSQSEMMNQEENPGQQNDHRTTSHVFTQQELFEMLTVFCPVYTQDWLACDHSLNLSSQDLFDSSDSQELLHPQNSRNKSPSAIISNSQELHTHPVVLSAGTQERVIPEQRTPEMQAQIVHLQQQQTPETVDSFLASQEKANVKGLEECSPTIPSQSTQEHPLRATKLRGEEQLSLMETEAAVPQCKNVEDEMEPARSLPNSDNQPPILQDAVQLSQTPLEQPCLLEAASQNEVPPGQETNKKNFLAPSEIAERTLGRSDPNDEKMPLDKRTQNKSCEHESSSQIPDIKPLEMTHVSSLLPENDSPLPNITSTPISCQPTRQQEDDRPRETCNLPLFTSPDPLSSQGSLLDQPSYIQPWLMSRPKQPSYKLLRSKVFRNCNVYNEQYPVTKMETARNEFEPLTTGTQLLETNSSKHSLMQSKEDLDPSSYPQIDKDSNPFPNSWAASSSLSFSSNLSSISSGSCDIVSPSDSNSAELFFMSTPEKGIDQNYNFINKHLIQGINACIIKLYRNQQLDVVEDGQVYTIYI